MSESDFLRYLDAKRTVDERAFDRRVRERFRRELAGVDPPVRVLEVGAGIGTTVAQVLEWKGLGEVRYTAIERRPEAIDAARDRIADSGREAGYAVDAGPDRIELSSAGRTCAVELVAADAFEYLVASERSWDALIAQAFLDLVDLPTALPRLFDALDPGGAFYFPITFDGGTIFEPTVDPELDERIVDLYHRSMDERTRDGEPAGHSRTGRRLFSHVPAAGGEISAAGGSDWVVHPRDGAYPADEAYFLRYVLGTIEGELTGEIDRGELDRWLARRREQVDRGELAYVAHQLDVTGLA